MAGKGLKSTEVWGELNKLKSNPRMTEIMDHFYGMVNRLKKEDRSFKHLDNRLTVINSELSAIGHRLTLKQVEKLAIMSQYDVIRGEKEDERNKAIRKAGDRAQHG